MKKVLLTIFIFSSLLVFSNVKNVLAFDFKSDSGLNSASIEAGYLDVARRDDALVGRIGEVISLLLNFLGVIFLVLMIYGGYIWMMSRGNEQEVAKAKSTITNALIGLILVLGAYAITWFITDKLNPWNAQSFPEGTIIEEDL